MTDLNQVPTAMSTSALESKLRDLREKSNKHSQLLTQKLASSQSGQNLLHIGTSLSTLPPDLHSLLMQLHPVLSSAEATEKQNLQRLQKLVNCGNEIRLEQRKVKHARECAELYQDLLAAEAIVKKDASHRRFLNNSTNGGNSYSNGNANHHETENGVVEGESDDKLDHVVALERCAHTTLCLVQDLEFSTTTLSTLTTKGKTAPATSSPSASQPDSSMSSNALPSLRTPLEDDMERAQFLMKLASRIRRLESDAIICLSQRMEQVLRDIQHCRERQLEDDVGASDDRGRIKQQEDLLLMIGHCMRGLALLGRSREVESIFARVAIMPLIRSKVSMGRLDEGGARGECAGLFSLLDSMARDISKVLGPVLRLAESTFDVGSTMEVDLLTAGVWVPIATALMADAGIKMAIFSPGIASILQANYVALDTFLSQLSERLLTEPSGDLNMDKDGSDSGNIESLYFCPKLTSEHIQKAQDRIYAHPKTADFSKKWNLPIYYQLRFGDCCNRLNKAVEITRKGGWLEDVFSGTEERAEYLKQTAGFELSLFVELYDILLGMWSPDVILRPLTHRFLRGAVQMVGRIVAFIRDGMEGKIKFGVEQQEVQDLHQNGIDKPNGVEQASSRTLAPYCWGENERDVAAVAWELAVLETAMVHDYVEVVSKALAGADSTESELQELRQLSSEVLKESSVPIRPLVETAWNEIIVKILTERCSGPLAAVKGVAATYRMTNRPPPTQASPFVSMILRPLREFDDEFLNRTPHYIGLNWKEQIVQTVAERYSVAVEELITTVQKTEVALQNRRARRANSGGMSDGDKVKLQLYLDFQEFSRNVEQVGVDFASIEGIKRLQTLTGEAQKLHPQNGST